MYRYHVGNRQHQEGALWHGPSLVLKINLKTLRIPELIGYDSPSERKIRAKFRAAQKGLTCGQRVAAIQVDDLQ